MKRLIQIFSYDQSVAENDDLVEMRYKATLDEEAFASYSSMFPAPRQRHIDAQVLTDEQLENIQTPTLLIHGREDRVVPLETSWKLANSLPNAELHVFSKCGHWTQIERTEAFCNLAMHFFK